MSATPVFCDTSSYLATLSLQRHSTVNAPSTFIYAGLGVSDSKPAAQHHFKNGKIDENPKDLEFASLLLGLKDSLGDEKVRPSRGQKRAAIGSESENDSNGIDESFFDSDDLGMKQSHELFGERKKRSPDGYFKAFSFLKEKNSDSEEKLGSPMSMFEDDEISALDGDDQEQIPDSCDDSSFQPSYFMKSFEERNDDLSPKPKRRFHGTPFATIACEYHTQLHARCPPHCPERRPARPHPRSKKAKNVEDFAQSPKRHETPRSSDSEIVPILDEDEDYEESDSKFSRLSASKKARSKKNTPTRTVGRTGRKYLPQACDRHKLLHAKCPANCPDRIARDQKLSEHMAEDSDC